MKNGSFDMDEQPENSKLDEESLKEIFNKHYTITSKDSYPDVKFRKTNRLSLKMQKKPLVLPKVLRKEFSQSSSSYQFVEGETIESVETFLDEQHSPRLFFEMSNNSISNNNNNNNNNNKGLTKNNSGSSNENSIINNTKNINEKYIYKNMHQPSLVPMLNTAISTTNNNKVVNNAIFRKEKGTYLQFGLGHTVPNYDIKPKIKDGKRMCSELVDEQELNKFTHEIVNTVDHQGEILDKLNEEMNETRKDISKAYLLMMKHKGGSFIFD